MFTKALIVEDQATIGRSLMDVLPKKRLAKEAFITHYCDDALFKIRAELKLGKGYDLLVTDLSFIEDKHPQKIKSGYELIAAVRDLHIDINIAVISVETRIAPIRELFEVYKIDAFIEKGRDEIQELIAAVQELKEGGIYKSKNLIEKLKNYSSYPRNNRLRLYRYKIAGQRLYKSRNCRLSKKKWLHTSQSPLSRTAPQSTEVNLRSQDKF